MLHDLLRFWSDVRFTWPLGLALLAVPIWLVLLDGLRRSHLSRRFTQIGHVPTLQSLITPPPRLPWPSRLMHAFAFVLLAIGLAGPSWGTGESDGVLVGRDLVLVLDMSRSMLAADTVDATRFDTANLAAQDLVEHLRQRGGHRVAVVLSAARPLLWVPLTADHDYALTKLRELDPDHPPLLVRPTAESRSGTRLGAGLLLALQQLDDRFPNSLDVLLLSDGDDPLNDEEWRTGLTTARRLRVPLYTVGLGDPDPERAATILLNGQLLESPDANGIPQPVRTALRENVLQTLAESTGGLYLPSHRERPKLVNLFREVIEPKPSRERAEEAPPRRRNQASWFFVAALLLGLAAWQREQ